MDTSQIEQELEIIKTLNNAGFKSYFVGGCVRDYVITQRDPSKKTYSKDHDIATNAKPQEVVSLFSRVLTDGETHGVVKVIVDGKSIDVATFRKESSESDGRRPETVEFIEDFDAERRDFTINALAWDFQKGEIYDPLGLGIPDIFEEKIRCVGNPEDRFKEDHLRMLRAVRLAAQLDFDIDAKTFQAIQDNASDIINISAERIREELLKILDSNGAVRGVRLLMESDLLFWILPEVFALQGCEQDSIHHPEGDVYIHSLGVLGSLISLDAPLEVKLAGLLHDIGKYFSVQHYVDKEGRSRISNLGHDKKGAELWLDISDRLKFDNDTKRVVFHIINLHMKAHFGRDMKRSTLLEFLRGPEELPQNLKERVVEGLILLQHADGLNSAHAGKTCYEFYREAQKTLGESIDCRPLLSGKDVLEIPGAKPGKVIGKVLKSVREAQDSGLITTKDQAVQYAITILPELSNSFTSNKTSG